MNGNRGVVVKAEYAVGTLIEQSLSGGVVAIWEAKRACMLAHADPKELTEREYALLDAEMKTHGELVANQRSSRRCGMRAVEKMYAEGKLPLWRLVSGIFPEMDLESMHPNERAGRLTQLIRAMERVCRYEWRRFKEKSAASNASALTGRGAGAGAGSSGGVRGNSGDCPLTPRDGTAVASALSPGGEGLGGSMAGEVDDPRVSWWDPLRYVCGQFGMAYATLSRFAREVTGLSASDLADRVKAEKMRKGMRAEVKEWLIEAYREHPEWKELSNDEAFRAVLAFVQKKRGQGIWSRASWAVRFGYSSYTRFNRAALASYGVSPVELEKVIVEEVLEEMDRREEGAPGAGLEREGNSAFKSQNSKVETDAGEGIDDC